MRALAAITLLSLSALGYANAPVEAVALFKDRAVVRVGGEEVMLSVGETSEHGVLLVSANAHGALVKYRGEAHSLNLSNRVTTKFSSPELASVRLTEDQLGQYRTRGSINGHYVNFLVDTGASAVALSSRLADQIGLDYRRAQKGPVHTAQGVAEAHFVPLEEVTVGSISLTGVNAMIILGDFPVDVLLGMSFLNKVKMQNEAGVLMLSARR